MGKTICFAPIRGRRLRVTRVDNVGRPVYGVTSQVTTRGFVSVGMTGEIEEGEDTTVKAADGTLCVSERSEDQLKWLNVEISLCSVDPDLVAMLNPNWLKLSDYRGNTIGWAETYNYSSDSGIALELWTDISNHTETDPNAQGAWVYFLLAWIVGGTVGDITVENGAITFTLTGRTKKGAAWGVGPYDVMLNAPLSVTSLPLPGPLLVPVGPDEPRRVFVTTVRPPEPMCGAQPLSSPTGPAVALQEITTDINRRTVGLTLSAASGSYRVDWGDGTSSEALPTGTTALTHTYATADTYNIAVWSTARPTDITVLSVAVPFTGTVLPAVVLHEDTSDTVARRTVSATVNNHSNGAVSIDWGDGSATTSNPGNGSTVSTHVYATQGTYRVVVSDASDNTLVSRTVVRVPFGQAIPVLTITEDTTVPTRLRTLVAVDNHGLGPVVVNWGDGSATGLNPGDGTTTIGHTYGGAGTYSITVVDPNDPTATATDDVVLPWGPVMTLAVATSDSEQMTTQAVVDNFGEGSVSIDWGDGTSDSTNVGDGAATTTHKYAEDGTYTVTATDATDPTRLTTGSVTVPYAGSLALTLNVVESSPPGSPRRKVTATWDNQGQGPVKLLWGLMSETPTTQPESGSADNTYTVDGTFTVRVTDATVPTRTVAQVVVVPFT